MSLAQDVSNQSIRQAISTIAAKVDEISSSPIQDVSALTGAISDLKAQVKALNEAINGVPVVDAPGELPAPTTPV